MSTLAELIAPHLTQGLLADKLHVLKYLAANPWLSRFYAGYFKLCRRNPSLLKVLGDEIVFFTDPNLVIAQAKLEKQEARQIEIAERKAEKRRAKRKAKRRARAEKLKAARLRAENRKGSKTMSQASAKKIRVQKMLNQKTVARKPGSAKIPQSCLHVKVNGVKCAAPALRGEVFCYFHQRLIRGVTTPPRSRLHPIAFLEDETSIQASLMEVVNALVRNTIDYRRAQLILRALHIAVKNSPRVQFEAAEKKMVDEIPEFPAAPVRPDPAESAAEESEEKYRNVYRPMPPDPVAIAKSSILAALPVHTRPKSPLPPLPSIPPGVMEGILEGLSPSDLRI